MELVVRTVHGDAEITASNDHSDVTIADIVAVVTGNAVPRAVRIDGRSVPSDTPITSSGALAGSIIGVGEPTVDHDAEPVAVLAQSAGRGSGEQATLCPGSYVLGPSRRINASELSEAPVDEPTVRLDVATDGSIEVRHLVSRHASAPDASAPEASAPAASAPAARHEDERRDQPDRDEPSAGPTAAARLDGAVLGEQPVPWTTGPLAVGGRVYEIRRTNDASTRRTGRRVAGVSTDGMVAFNRPPRRALIAEEAPLSVPEGGDDVRTGRRFPLLAMLAPLPIAVAMALLLGSPRFLLFGLMSPVMVGASWLSDRRQRKHDLHESAGRNSSAETEFRTAVAARYASERARRRANDLHMVDVDELSRQTAPQLWARRPGDDDAFAVTIGIGDIPWRPPLDRTSSSISSADRIIDDVGVLHSVPIIADLRSERGVGVVGDREFTEACASGLLLHACTSHGPADLDIIVLSSPDRVASWEWVKWIPHARLGGQPRIYTDEATISAWALAVERGWQRPSRPSLPSHITMVVVDQPDWWRSRTAPLRSLFSDPTMPLRFLTLTDLAEDVPAVCTTLLLADADGTATVDHLLTGERIVGVAPFAVHADRAVDIARRLAPLDDPDLALNVESSLPSVVPIAELLGLDAIDSDAILQRWRSGERPARPTVVAGVAEQGPVHLDLIDDGPHGLVAGTTGAGKSELLRSLIVGLATNLQPDEINFVLVDFKGGSAFDACAALPHTVGMVTDLDEHLAGRMLRCLRAELQHREHILRAVEASSLDEYQRIDGVSPLPRLVLVVDEFASVAAELPEFLPSLVDIAQRGRSLGIHMILATQRPAGVVDNKIKANTNLRIALRVQDDGDSLDVIGTRDAANLPRRAPGRAYARFAAGELTLFQSAYSTGTSSGARSASLRVEPFVIGRPLTPIETRLRRIGREPDVSTDLGRLGAPTDLERLVDAIGAASDALGQSDQRPPAPPPLPTDLDLRGFFDAHAGDGVPLALVDMPDEQRQIPLFWQPGATGSFIAYGIAGAGTSSALLVAALGIAERCSADDVHVYALDADTNSLAPLAALPHCGAVVRVNEPDRLMRLVRNLTDEVERRKSLAAELGGPARVAAREPAIVLLIDNVGGLRQTLDDDREQAGTWPDLERIIRDGQPLGVTALLTAKQERAVPTSLATQIPTRFVMRLGDPFAYAGFGLRPGELPTFLPGRAVRPDDRVELQLVSPPDDLAAHIAALGIEQPSEHRPLRVEPLPSHILVEQVVTASSMGSDGLRVAVGLDTQTARPALAAIPFGENFFVTGSARSGRSSVLLAIAAAARHVSSDLPIFAVTPRGGPLRSAPAVTDAPSEPADVAAWVERIATTPGRRLVLVDDADRIGGPSFERLGAIVDDELIVVMAGRSDGLRSMNHWSKPLQRGRNGVLIRPTMVDGELLRTPLGTRLPRFAPHMGFLVVDGEVTPLLAAVATPPEARS
jgi:DNA segregation ATPase FtsK/SpoIIIE, S-DNA-T family